MAIIDENNLFFFYFKLIIWFFIWTLAEYLLHRFMHYNHPLNIFFKIHRHHHIVELEKLTSANNRWPTFSNFFFWFDSINDTIEILFGETMPALIIYYIDPECGLIILIFHYIYEVLAAGSLIEHNSEIKNPMIIKTFAVGQFHLEHHRHTNKNFGFTFTLWDHIFGTYKFYSEK